MRNEIKETVTITRTARTETYCDICGDNCDSIRGSSYDDIRVEIRIREGSSYPEGGWGDEYEPDICLTCAKEKVIPALQALGCKAEWKKYDW
jgi:hypothetical protein